MSNVLQFRPPRRQETSARFAGLIEGFAAGRRLPDDVFWLKEVAELLGILKATGIGLTPEALAPLEPFYAQIEGRLRFFPQYYRFLLSICLDLEDLGLEGNKGRTMANWIASEQLVEAELSDLQRAEARRLLSRRGVDLAVDGLDDRLRRFIHNTATFAMPNKKAAYELTHIVFYLSDYGARDPGLDDKAVTSLTYCGLLAYLDQNADLLAEVCTALRFAGRTPSPIWEDAVAHAHRGIHVAADEAAPPHDAYHEYLVSGWMLQVAGTPAFETEIPRGNLRFLKSGAAPGALRTLSECMFELGDLRTDDWASMRPHVLPQLGQGGHAVLEAAEKSTDQFAPFFARFARAGR